MTLDEAIKVLELFGVDIKYWPDNEGQNALKLGIEALKKIKHLHEIQVLDFDELLPGETE